MGKITEVREGKSETQVDAFYESRMLQKITSFGNFLPGVNLQGYKSKKITHNFWRKTFLLHNIFQFIIRIFCLLDDSGIFHRNIDRMCFLAVHCVSS